MPARLAEGNRMPDRIDSIDAYVNALRQELAGADPALTQDALFDVRQHLETALAERVAARPDTAREALLADVIARFGEPAEIARAYAEAERRIGPVWPAPPQPRPSLTRRIFGVFVDPHAYGSLFYMVLLLATGTFYFTWAVTGLSLTVGLLVLIIGIPFGLLFLATVRALALIEGRVVEALLGVRMPRRPQLGAPGSFWARLEFWVTDARTWSTILYLLLGLPLGVVYGSVAIALAAVSFAFMGAPIMWLLPAGDLAWSGGESMPFWGALLLALAGFALLLGTLHLARAVGRLHGALAKVLLVRAFARREEPAPAPARREATV